MIKRSLGQHFLNDAGTAAKIVAAAAIDPHQDRVVEIGPGRGALTGELAQTGAPVVAIEKDETLGAALTQRFDILPQVSIIMADILEYPLTPHLDDSRRTVVVGNLPYNISTRILFLLLDNWQHLDRLVLMFQREVALRLTARPGSKQYGAPTVMTHLYCDTRLLFHVKPGSFYPPPKVDSSVVHFGILKQPRYPVEDQPLFRRIVQAAFGSRRKMLSNALMVAHMGSRTTISNWLREAGINPNARAEQLSLESFFALYRTWKQHGGLNGGGGVSDGC